MEIFEPFLNRKIDIVVVEDKDSSFKKALDLRTGLYGMIFDNDVQFETVLPFVFDDIFYNWDRKDFICKVGDSRVVVQNNFIPKSKLGKDIIYRAILNNFANNNLSAYESFNVYNSRQSDN